MVAFAKIVRVKVRSEEKPKISLNSFPRPNTHSQVSLKLMALDYGLWSLATVGRVKCQASFRHWAHLYLSLAHFHIHFAEIMFMSISNCRISTLDRKSSYWLKFSSTIFGTIFELIFDKVCSKLVVLQMIN